MHKTVSAELQEWLHGIRLDHIAGILGDAGYDQLDSLIDATRSDEPMTLEKL
jgi:hypothetical protein